MNKHKFETDAIRNQMPASQNQEHSAPLYLTSSFVFNNAEELRAAFNEENDAFIYSRYGNPNTDEFVAKVVQMEGAEAGISTASGMAAIYASFMALLSSGDHVISCSSVFGATHTIFTKYFPRLGIKHSYFNADDPSSIEALIKPETKFIYLETPTNPAIEVIDLELVGHIAKKAGLLLLVDNCFATPFLQKPIEYGADIVIHSATKYMDGQGRVLGGVVVGRADLIREIYLYNRITGASLSAFNAWVLSKSLETLSIRMERHCENALQVAKFLEGKPGIKKVKYPFLESHPQYDIAKKQMRAGGGIVAFSLSGGLEAGAKFMDNLSMIKISPNLGDSRTIATHPASSTHCKLTEEERLAVGIDDGLIRISVGLEHIDDIIADISKAISNSIK
ncbi:MAG: aminotransferase class I/II-fold pyridoxal phosphate-dependent enzyme [Saprospiraceae bacterium]|jgi:O-succinylhomoserine sulfhydrylase|nr:aminotransferase class I/II-fold pyridoxal phosphate-dependent enzyme [Saprospiraceae bacterium]